MFLKGNLSCIIGNDFLVDFSTDLWESYHLKMQRIEMMGLVYWLQSEPVVKLNFFYHCSEVFFIFKMFVSM